MTRKRKIVSPAAEADTRKAVAGLAKVAGRLKGWKPAGEVLTKVRAVPTIFPQFDRATRCGGYPIERVTVIHGPSGEGKTIFAHGLGLSFLKLGHFYAPIDAEFTSPEDWLRKLLGEQFSNPAFLAQRPTSYEQAVNAVRELVKAVGDGKAKGDLSQDTSALVVVDSIRKLVPENFLAKIRLHGADGKKGSIDGSQGRGGQLKAKLNAEWLDELIPMLYATGTGICLIGREVDDPDADIWDHRKGEGWKLTGGKALKFESSLSIRITRDGWIKNQNDAVVGERHRVRIYKTKVGGKEDSVTDVYFHTSNGVDHPEGFWRSRDMLDLAEVLDVIKHTGGSWFKWGTFKKWNGRAAIIRWLDDNAEKLDLLEEECRAEFKNDNLEQQIESIGGTEA